jgi:hypothetical protein
MNARLVRLGAGHYISQPSLRLKEPMMTEQPDDDRHDLEADSDQNPERGDTNCESASRDPRQAASDRDRTGEGQAKENRENDSPS